MVDESIDEYVLGILEPAHQTAIERHLIRCIACSKLAASYQQTAAVLALAVPLVQPPASARTALMARIAQTPRTAAVVPTVYAGSLESLRTPTLPASSSLAPQVAPQTQTSWWKVYAAPLATLPLLLALGLVAAWGFNTYAKLENSNDALDQSNSQMAMLLSQISNENSQDVANVLSSPSAQRYSLLPEVASTDDHATGTLTADPQSEQAVLRVTGLSSGTYSVVVQMQDGRMVPKAEFFVGTPGFATTLVNLGAQVSDLQSIHIRPTTSVTETDVAAIEAQPDVLMTTIGPNFLENSDTFTQAP